MFFLKKKQKKEFDIFDNKRNHVDFKGNKTFSSSTDHLPYLWTSDLAACIGIGLLYLDDKNPKLELYHSVSEHSLDDIEIENALKDRDPFVNVLFNFLNQLNETSQLKIYLSSNEHSTPMRDRSHVHTVVSKCIKYINQSQSRSLQAINIRQLITTEVEGGTFFVTAKGKSGSIVSALSEAISEIKKLFADEKSLYNSALYKEYLKITNNEAPYDSRVAYANEKHAFEQLKELASDFLSKKHSPDQKAIEQLAIKIVSWDLILNQPDNELFQLWQEQHTKFNYESPSMEIK